MADTAQTETINCTMTLNYDLHQIILLGCHVVHSSMVPVQASVDAQCGQLEKHRRNMCAHVPLIPGRACGRHAPGLWLCGVLPADD